MSNRRLATVFVGKSRKDYSSEVDLNLLVVDVSHCFEQYIKLYVKLVKSTASSFTSNAEGSGMKCILKLYHTAHQLF